jgi:predicted outer membrane repeat protein
MGPRKFALYINVNFSSNHGGEGGGGIPCIKLENVFVLLF